MGSARLPSKMMMDSGGRPGVHWGCSRVKQTCSLMKWFFPPPSPCKAIP
ncbi:MAG: hypothetical protein KKF43_16545 [Proteobacteria bacterium]|nr:hypothetical protein [Pseudomonadota bacterium]